ncbi:MAG TPA: hypothetical protein VFP06_19095 [Acidimicrobiales bacterium]|nr:hypothetical protein [Acidimicrobiales bacterium]
MSKSCMGGDGVLTLPGALVLGGLAASALLATWSKGRMIGAGGRTDGTDCPPPPCSLY